MKAEHRYAVFSIYAVGCPPHRIYCIRGKGVNLVLVDRYNLWCRDQTAPLSDAFIVHLNIQFEKYFINSKRKLSLAVIIMIWVC